jgi:hypothetical protein
MALVKWSGWLEKKGRSTFSKVEHRFFILKEGSSTTGELLPGTYSFEYYAAPAHLKSAVGRDLGADPASQGFEKKGSLDVAVRPCGEECTCEA